MNEQEEQMIRTIFDSLQRSQRDLWIEIDLLRRQVSDLKRQVNILTTYQENGW